MYLCTVYFPAVRTAGRNTDVTLPEEHGYAFPSRAQRAHVEDSRQEQQARGPRSTNRPRAWLPIQIARRRSSRSAGSRFAGAPESDIRPRLLLASASRVRPGATSEVAPRILGAEARLEQTKGWPQPSSPHETWLAVAGNLGMRDAGHRQAGTPNPDVPGEGRTR